MMFFIATVSGMTIFLFTRFIVRTTDENTAKGLALVMTNYLWIALLLTSVSWTRGQHTPIITRDPMLAAKTMAEKIIKVSELEKEIELLDLSLYKKGLTQDTLEKMNSSFGSALGCAKSLLQHGKDLINREPYALRMVDAWGKFSSGIATGNLYWTGRYYECVNAYTDNFSGKYCSLNVGQRQMMTTVTPLIAIGSCVPSTCSQEDIEGVYKTLANITHIELSASCPVQPTKYTGLDIFAIIVCIILGCIVITGTCIELILATWVKKTPEEDFLGNSETVPLVGQEQHSTLKEFLVSFSVIKNTKLILDVSQKEGNINVLHGLRFISMSWVMLGHTFFFSMNFFDNTLDYAEYFVTHGSFQAIANATFSVDSFFFLSGLLATYLGMREIGKRKGQISILPAYLYRYLRLTPAYALCILLSSSIYSKMGDGPSWPKMIESVHEPCKKYWWTNLLYINNVHPSTLGEETDLVDWKCTRWATKRNYCAGGLTFLGHLMKCFAHSWYLANDMQFFLLTPFLLMLLHRSSRAGMATMCSIIFSSIMITFGLSYHYKEQPQVVGIGSLCQQMLGAFSRSDLGTPESISASNVTTTPAPPLQMTEADVVFSDLYAKPWCRIGTYLIGMIAGYFLHKWKLRLRMNKIVVLGGWVVATITALSVLYGLWPHAGGKEINLLHNGTAAFYNAVSRPLWALCLTWLVMACVSGYGGPINHFLSWKFFIPLSRLTYCAYLVHPFVMYWFYASYETRMHFSPTIVSIYFLGFLLLSYGIAYIISLIVEMPLVGITKLLLKGNKPSKDVVATHPINDATTDEMDA